MNKFLDKKTVKFKVKSVCVQRAVSGGWVVKWKPEGFLASWELYKICHNEKDARTEADLLVMTGFIEREYYTTHCVDL